MLILEDGELRVLAHDKHGWLATVIVDLNLIGPIGPIRTYHSDGGLCYKEFKIEIYVMLSKKNVTPSRIQRFLEI